MPRFEARWAAVLARDAAADGQFVYAVRSTGVYCRPSCGARRPRRDRVSFHRDGAAAKAAGFRACRRCHPDQPRSAPGDTAIAAACRVLDQEEPQPAPSLAVLAAAAGVTAVTFRRRFRAATGLSPRAWAAAAREERVRLRLRAGSGITEAFYAAGFGSSGRFYAAADRALGMVPGRFRAGAGRIRYALGRSSLGAVLAAESERGVCAILLGEDAAALEGQLRRQFPAAKVVRADAALQRRLAQVLALVEAPGAGPRLPLDLRGTALQRRVWRALRRIPAGSRISYGALARRLGLPQGARAVARACAANPLAVAVPCHRVVRGDGALAGYRWGVERKRQLLAREAQT